MDTTCFPPNLLNGAVGARRFAIINNHRKTPGGFEVTPKS